MDIEQVKTPWHLWVVGVLAALWNMVGVVDFTSTVTKFEPYMSQFPQEAFDYYYSMPVWMFVVWGIAVWAGVIGTVLLLCRKSMALAFLGASLAALSVSFVTELIAPAPDAMSSPVWMAAIVVIAVAVLAYALWMSRRNVLS